MKKQILILLGFIALMQVLEREARAVDPFENDKVYREYFMNPKSTNVVITGVAVSVPLERIMLVRKDSDYCAVKFTKFWTENTSEVDSIFVAGSDEYANYESYYQNDKTGDFSNKNVKFKKAKLLSPKLRGIGRLAFKFFADENIQCGPIKLFWFGHGSLHFWASGDKQGDYGIELAPTKWTDISQINVFDPRLTWYKYDGKRKNIIIPIEQLWEDEKGPEQKK